MTYLLVITRTNRRDGPLSRGSQRGSETAGSIPRERLPEIRWQPSCTDCTMSSPTRGGGTRRRPARRSGRTTGRAPWRDGTTREGWKTHYATVGASLWSIPSERWALLSNCWVARGLTEAQPGFELGSAESSVIEAMLKLLRRGTAPPMHPKAETSLRLQLGANAATPLPDDFAVPASSVADIEISLMNSDSDAEGDLVEWMERRRQGVARWLVPQPSFDDLVGEPVEGDTRSERYWKCDFLFSPPGLPPVVIEVDGGQHAQQESVDASRDKDLCAAGYETIRVPTSELGRRVGPGLDRLRELIDHSKSFRSSAINPLVWAPVQTHRLMLGLCEAIAAGWLKGPAWNVEVSDFTGLSAGLIGPYLELLDAFDLMWGMKTVAPHIATFRYGNQVAEWRRMGPCAYQSYAPESETDPHPDVEIRLDAEHLPVEKLPESGHSRMVIIRSATITHPLPDPSRGQHSRATPFVEASDGEAMAALGSILQGVFDKEAFMKGQSEAIMEVLAGRDCVVLLPTGGGKSLVYQLAGLCLPGRTLVVDPLVALIEDQELALREYGMDRVVGISHSNRDDDFTDAYFVLVAPERLQRKDFQNEIRSLVIGETDKSGGNRRGALRIGVGTRFQAGLSQFGEGVAGCRQRRNGGPSTPGPHRNRLAVGPVRHDVPAGNRGYWRKHPGETGLA